MTGYPSIGNTANEPIQFFVTNFGVRETVTWIKGEHVMKFGVDNSQNRFNMPFFNNSHGTMTASGIWSGAGTATNGDAIADLELGLLASSTITQQIAHNYMRNREDAFFFTDAWKIRHDLTLNLGVRYEIDGAPYDQRGLHDQLPAAAQRDCGRQSRQYSELRAEYCVKFHREPE